MARTREVAHRGLLESNALHGDSLLTAASAALAATTLIALVLSTRLGWWWADAVAAMLIAGALVFEATRAAAYRRSLVRRRRRPRECIDVSQSASRRYRRFGMTTILGRLVSPFSQRHETVSHRRSAIVSVR
jgi:hypothetical protein